MDIALTWTRYAPEQGIHMNIHISMDIAAARTWHAREHDIHEHRIREHRT